MMYHLARYEYANQLAYQIVSAAQFVYRTLGPNQSKDEYRRAMTNMLKQRRLEVETLFPVDVWQSSELAELYFLDLFIDWQAVVEIRTQRRPFMVEERALMTEYLCASGAVVGMLFNFGARKLEYELVFPER